MPLPIILGGAVTLLAAGFSAKKTYDKKRTLNDTKNCNKASKKIYFDTLDTVNASRKKARHQIEEFAQFKITGYQTHLHRYIDIYSKIEQIETAVIELNNNFDSIDCIGTNDLADINNVIVHLNEIFKQADSSSYNDLIFEIGARGIVHINFEDDMKKNFDAAFHLDRLLSWFTHETLEFSKDFMIPGEPNTHKLNEFHNILETVWKESDKNKADENYTKTREIINELLDVKGACENISNTILRFIEVIKLLEKSFQSSADKLDQTMQIHSHYASFSKEERDTLYKLMIAASTLKKIYDIVIIDENDLHATQSFHLLASVEDFAAQL